MTTAHPNKRLQHPMVARIRCGEVLHRTSRERKPLSCSCRKGSNGQLPGAPGLSGTPCSSKSPVHLIEFVTSSCTAPYGVHAHSQGQQSRSSGSGSGCSHKIYFSSHCREKARAQGESQSSCMQAMNTTTRTVAAYSMLRGVHAGNEYHTLCQQRMLP